MPELFISLLRHFLSPGMYSIAGKKVITRIKAKPPYFILFILSISSVAVSPSNSLSL